MKFFFPLHLLFILAIVNGLPNNLYAQDFNPLAWPSSMHNVILNPKNDKLFSAVSKECLKEVRNFINNKKNFKSSVVAKYSMAFKDHPLYGDKKYVFYHYTNVEKLIPLVQTQNAEAIFSLIHSRPVTNGTPFSVSYLYVAMDLESSKKYGKILVAIQPYAEGTVFFSGGDYPGKEIPRKELVNSIESEMVQKESKLKACRAGEDAKNITNGQQPLLLVLAAEANGVSEMVYYGLVNRLDPITKGKGIQWLQIVGPWAIQSMEIQPLP